MERHGLLRAVHAAYRPRNYIEIGIDDGRGLRLSKTRTIGVDPAYRITAEFECDVKMVRATSDDFFARDDAIARFPEGVVDFTFIDGLHIFEFALRDFMNAERLSSPNSVIILDDMLPRTVIEAARDRKTRAWAGDVYKVAFVLERYRPDLIVVPLDTAPTGLLLVLGLDPASTVLTDHYDEILAEFVSDDPQNLPDEIVHRRRAADPKRVLDLPIWADLAAARDSGGDRPSSLASARELRGTATYISNPPAAESWPPRPKNPTPPAPPVLGALPPPPPRTVVARVRRRLRRWWYAEKSRLGVS